MGTGIECRSGNAGSKANSEELAPNESKGSIFGAGVSLENGTGCSGVILERSVLYDGCVLAACVVGRAGDV
jgi:hypothetical protein